LIIVYLVVRGRAIPLRSFVIDKLPRVGTGRIRPPVIATLAVVVALVLVLVPVQWATAITVTIAFAIITLSVVVITGYAGQLSLAQYVLAGVGALSAARLSADWHFAFPLALLGALVVTAVAGAVLAIPSLRARGISLAIATLAAGMVLFNVVLSDDRLSGGENGVTEQVPSLFGWSLDPSAHPARYGMAVLVVLVLLSLGVANIRRGRAGRRMLAVRSNERAAAALGVSVYGAKVYGFTVAAGIAGVGGMLYAFMSPVVTASGFDQLSSINFVTVTVVGGVGNIQGAPIGATMISGGVVSQIFFGFQNINAWVPLVGSVALLIVLRRHSSGLFELNRHQLARLAAARVWHRRPKSIEPTDAVTALPVAPHPVTPKTLRVENLRVAFGGVVAVNGVSLTVRPGEVHSLIGPNGAGKTTFIDAVTGFVVTSGGRILLNEVDITRSRARRRSRLGIARTFQSLELFGDLSVRENLAVASDDGRLRRYVTDIFRPGPVAVAPTVLDAMRATHLDDTLDVTPDSLPFGRRRLIAIMRALAAEPSVLLLDEPAAGLSDSETEELGRLVRDLASTRNIAVLLIEHNLDMVSAISDRMTVLTSGGILAEGTPSEVLAHPAVLETYVGELVA
jgi:sulfate-transporting ATPase